MPDALGDPRVRTRLAERNEPGRLEHAPLERGRRRQVDGHGEEAAPAREVLGDLLTRQVGEPAARCRLWPRQSPGSDQADAVGASPGWRGPLEPVERGRLLPRRPKHARGEVVRRGAGREVVVQQLIETRRGREIAHG